MKTKVCKQYIREIAYNNNIRLDERDLLTTLRMNYDKVRWDYLPRDNKYFNLMDELNIVCEIQCPNCRCVITIYYPREKFESVFNGVITPTAIGDFYIPSINLHVRCRYCDNNNYNYYSRGYYTPMYTLGYDIPVPTINPFTTIPLTGFTVTAAQTAPAVPAVPAVPAAPTEPAVRSLPPTVPAYLRGQVFADDEALAFAASISTVEPAIPSPALATPGIPLEVRENQEIPAGFSAPRAPAVPISLQYSRTADGYAYLDYDYYFNDLFITRV